MAKRVPQNKGGFKMSLADMADSALLAERHSLIAGIFQDESYGVTDHARLFALTEEADRRGLDTYDYPPDEL